MILQLWGGFTGPELKQSRADLELGWAGLELVEAGVGLGLGKRQRHAFSVSCGPFTQGRGKHTDRAAPRHGLCPQLWPVGLAIGSGPLPAVPSAVRLAERRDPDVAWPCWWLQMLVSSNFVLIILLTPEETREPPPPPQTPSFLHAQPPYHRCMCAVVALALSAVHYRATTTKSPMPGSPLRLGPGVTHGELPARHPWFLQGPAHVLLVTAAQLGLAIHTSLGGGAKGGSWSLQTILGRVTSSRP